MEDYSRALEYQQKAFAINKKILGEQHTSTGQSYNNIGLTYDAMGDYSKAYDYAEKSYLIFMSDLDDKFAVLNSGQERQYLQDNNYKIQRLLSSANAYQQSLQNNNESKDALELVQTIMNNWLAYKGSILDNENRLVSLAKTSKNPAIQKKYQQLVQVNQEYSKLTQKIPRTEEQNAWKAQLAGQEQQIDTLEREITQGDPRFKAEKALQDITSQTIANSLSEKELYIDYGKTSDGYYLFTIDHHNTISFTAFNETNSKTIDQYVKLFSDNIQIPAKQFKSKAQHALSKLYHLLIPPELATRIASKDSLIISPNGLLHLLPFEALYDNNNKYKPYLIQQKDIRYIASGKELVRLFQQKAKQQVTTNNNQAVLFANPNFNKKGIKAVHKPPIIIALNKSREIKLRSSGKRYSSLPATKTEAEAIIRILKKTNIRHYYEKDSATEANLLTIKRPSLLHIATHGFFDEKTSNPMLQSGIVLAGVNDSLSNDLGEGFVTALDLSGLDLKGTNLVVLSACETGKVDPNNTNGISGLTKAFVTSHNPQAAF